MLYHLVISGPQSGQIWECAEVGISPVKQDFLNWVENWLRGGKPCIRGMRITVYDVLSYLAAGMTPDEILEDFPLGLSLGVGARASCPLKRRSRCFCQAKEHKRFAF